MPRAANIGPSETQFADSVAGFGRDGNVFEPGISAWKGPRSVSLPLSPSYPLTVRDRSRHVRLGPMAVWNVGRRPLPMNSYKETIPEPCWHVSKVPDRTQHPQQPQQPPLHSVTPSASARSLGWPMGPYRRFFPVRIMLSRL
jgi:hypothetical protein